MPNLSALILGYATISAYEKLAPLIGLVPSPGTPLSPTHLSLIYALSEHAFRIEDGSLRGQLLAKQTALLDSLAQGSLAFTASNPLSQNPYFLLSFRLCCSLAAQGALQSAQFAPLLENAVRNADDDARLRAFCVAYGWLAASKKFPYLVWTQDADSIFELCSNPDNLTALETAVANLVVVPLSDSGSFSPGRSYTLVAAFNAHVQSELCALLFLKTVADARAAGLSHHVLKKPVKPNHVTKTLVDLKSRDIADEGDDATYDSLITNNELPSEVSSRLEQVYESLVKILEEVTLGAGHVIVSSTTRADLALATKSRVLRAFTILVYLGFINYERASRDVLPLIAEVADTELFYPGLATEVFGLLTMLLMEGNGEKELPALINRKLCNALLRSSGAPQGRLRTAVRCVAQGYRHMPQDTVVGLIYLLNNLLSIDERPKQEGEVENNLGENGVIQEHVVTLIIAIAGGFEDVEVSTLVLSVLASKWRARGHSGGLERALVRCAYALGASCDTDNFKVLVRDYCDRLDHAVSEGSSIVGDLQNALCRLGRLLKAQFSEECGFDGENKVFDLKKAPENYTILLTEFLRRIVLKGDSDSGAHHRSHSEILRVARTLEVYLAPLAAMLPLPYLHESALEFESGPGLVDLFRNVWFNMVVHGMNIAVMPLLSPAAKKCSTGGESVRASTKQIRVLELIAFNTPPLALKLSCKQSASALELNTVLRRGLLNLNARFQKSLLDSVETRHEDEIKETGSSSSSEEPSYGLSHRKISSAPKLMFLSATLFLECLRARTGVFHKVLLYFSDPSVQMGDWVKELKLVVYEVLHVYLARLHSSLEELKLSSCPFPAFNDRFASALYCSEVCQVLLLTCATDGALQLTALRACDLLVSRVPSTMCHTSTLFKLLDLLALLFDSVAGYEKNRYNPVLEYVLPGEKLIFLDSLEWRQNSFGKLQVLAEAWVLRALKSGVSVTRTLLEAYIALHLGPGIHMGVSFAMRMCQSVAQSDRELFSLASLECVRIPGSSTGRIDLASEVLGGYTARTLADETPESQDTIQRAQVLRNEVNGVYSQISEERRLVSEGELSKEDLEKVNSLTIKVISDMSLFLENLEKSSVSELTKTSLRAEFLNHVTELPFELPNAAVLERTIPHWLVILALSVEAHASVVHGIMKNFRKSVVQRLGLFSASSSTVYYPEYNEMQYAPSDKKETQRQAAQASESMRLHLVLTRLIDSFFASSALRSALLERTYADFALFLMRSALQASKHPFARLVRFEMIHFAFGVLHVAQDVRSFAGTILDAILDFFRHRKSPPMGDNTAKIRTDAALMKQIALYVQSMAVSGSDALKKRLCMAFLADELSLVQTWLNPLGEHRKEAKSPTFNSRLVEEAYSVDASLAVQLVNRAVNLGINASTSETLKRALRTCIKKEPYKSFNSPDSIRYAVEDKLSSLLYFPPVSPVDAINLFLPPLGSDPYVVQYAMKSLALHDVHVTFFYVPQIVQMLRFDDKGYVERFILETAQILQLFAHQIIWNMLANSYKDDEGTVEDPLKPTLDRIRDKMVELFLSLDREYYEREFAFFAEITGISAKLKPYIKKTKAEKKMKIDEEMRKIKLEQGVYLPSNPDGVLVDINRTLGKPLQSHAKAPFMATFKIKKEVEVHGEVEIMGLHKKQTVETWQAAIFKVGDDCRQDVLALQLILVFRSIWQNSNMDLFVFPYRVTATEAGCGIIDVLPNSVSRDMLGREAVNGLYEYFITKFGPEHTPEFQVARNNLVKLLAGYLIILYLLQFKDRHNGNIMYDDQGHVLHVDFGFCFDVVPGGVKFEAVPFKLTKEMVMVMGGNSYTQLYKRFEELCVQGFLAVRPYMEVIVSVVMPMLESGLPCFKGMTTIKNLRNRFVPGKTEAEAAAYMRRLIKRSCESLFTTGYDEFQRMTNGIPY